MANIFPGIPTTGYAVADIAIGFLAVWTLYLWVFAQTITVSSFRNSTYYVRGSYEFRSKRWQMTALNALISLVLIGILQWGR